MEEDDYDYLVWDYKDIDNMEFFSLHPVVFCLFKVAYLQCLILIKCLVEVLLFGVYLPHVFLLSYQKNHFLLKQMYNNVLFIHITFYFLYKFKY